MPSITDKPCSLGKCTGLPLSSISSSRITCPGCPAPSCPASSSSISSSASCISSCIFSFPAFIPFTSMNIFMLNTRKTTDTAICVHFHGMSMGSRCPIAMDRMDMTMREPNAPVKTNILGWCMARMVAMRKVLSLISETRIMAKDWMRACMSPSGRAFSKMAIYYGDNELWEIDNVEHHHLFVLHPARVLKGDVTGNYVFAQVDFWRITCMTTCLLPSSSLSAKATLPRKGQGSYNEKYHMGSNWQQPFNLKISNKSIIILEPHHRVHSLNTKYKGYHMQGIPWAFPQSAWAECIWGLSQGISHEGACWAVGLGPCGFQCQARLQLTTQLWWRLHISWWVVFLGFYFSFLLVEGGERSKRLTKSAGRMLWG